MSRAEIKVRLIVTRLISVCRSRGELHTLHPYQLYELFDESYFYVAVVSLHEYSV